MARAGDFMIRNTFVFVVCGNQHVERTRIALEFLRHFSRSNIVVVKSRADLQLECSQVIEPKVPRRLNNRQAGIFLKTSLHKILPLKEGRFCYLDNDVLAVNAEIDAIFDQASSPISFATDHCSFRQFSRYAVQCGCSKSECGHLHAAIRRQFGVNITNKAWQHWNGGVFVFDRTAAEFMERWHQNTLAAFKNPYWQTRDQGTLAATVWQLNLQNHPTLPREFNFIVDPFLNVPRVRRNFVKAEELPPNESYSLQDNFSKPHPRFVHFINGGIGKRGWKNWDDVERLLEAQERSEILSPDNRIVHSLWIGPKLSKMELLTIHSFLRHGHEFHLWVYDKIETPLPKGVVVEDANQIISQKRIIKKADTDPETGVGKGSFSSPFSDLFRYKLLYEKGGYWVDMDVTCLHPFNFPTPYVFRPHRVGIVGNIIKCPPRSRLMKLVYAKVSRQASEHADWLMPNKVLSQTVRRLKLTRFIRGGIWNPESWWGAVRPLALGNDPIPPDWFAIHWINEFWRTLKENGGIYRGQRLFTTVPDKENPKADSALARLYSDYRLSMPEAKLNGEPARQSQPAPLEKPAERQPVTPRFLMTSHINVLLPSLARGGAERSVLETLNGLQRRNSSGKMFVLHRTQPSYYFDGPGNIELHWLDSPDMAVKMHSVAMEVLASPEPVVFTHMVKADLLRQLWEHGVQTIPVIQNAKPAWQDPPITFKHPAVPFVVAVSEAVAQELRDEGCPKPVVVVRHELQRWFSPEDQQQNRRHIRDRYGISDGTLLIGMVGEFKSQKAYTRAVRVLARLRQIRSTKLMILGGWDHEWGHGRQAYTATCQLALEMEVITDMIIPGPVPDVEKYYAAFDVFLNTSAYEGLSVALLEAIQTACPIVTANAGGNREILPDHAVVVSDAADIDAYAQGIAQAVQGKSRTLVPKPADFDLVPRLWCLLGQYGRNDSYPPLSSRHGTLFVTDNLNTGAASKALVNLLCGLQARVKSWLCLLQPAQAQRYLDELQRKEVLVFSLQTSGDYVERVERILSIIGRLNVRNVCFWNVETRIKLLLAKILPRGTVHLVDVSPDSSLFFQMEHAATFQRRITFRAEDYWARLDHFVAKYVGGAPPHTRLGRKLAVIPDGVQAPAPCDPASQLLPPSADPNLVVGTICPIAPGKRIEFLIDVMQELNPQLHGTTLIIIGGLDSYRADYWPVLLDNLRSRGLTNIHFAGPHADVPPILKLSKVFLAVSEWPGFPPGCLEAMALGIPVVANSTKAVMGRTIKKGIVFAGGDQKAAAHQVRRLLTDTVLRRRLGKDAGRTFVSHFSLTKMVRSYSRLLAMPVR
jgi:glycosyltransferase involved in cell wall biosynthesis